LEELSVRANLALTQKKIVYDMGLGNGEDDFEREYLTLSAQVVSTTNYQFNSLSVGPSTDGDCILVTDRIRLR